METTIKRYRTFSYYPFNVIEAEVEVNGINAYINMEVRNGVQTSFDEIMITETFWSYNTPLTEIDDANDNYISLSTMEEENALNALINLWNKNPVFTNNETWTNMDGGMNMIEITVETIKENIHAHINDIMADIQTAEGIENGDIEPLDFLSLENKVEELAILIQKILVKQSQQS